MCSWVEAERAGRADRRFTLSPKRTLTRSSSLIIAALTGAVAAMAAATAAVALLAVPAAHAGTPTRTAGLGRAAGSRTALIPTPAITGAHLTIVLRHGTTAASTAIRLDSAASARARYARQTARKLLGHYGWGARQFTPLNELWNRESGWNKYASNPYSGAYGIPQAVPGSKMSSAGPHWQTNAGTQIRWGLRYIKSRYGSPAAAWGHELAYGWY